MPWLQSMVSGQSAAPGCPVSLHYQPQTAEGAAQLPGILRSGLGGPPAIVRRLYLFVFLGPGPMLGGGGGHWELNRYVRDAEAGLRNG